MEQTSSGNQNFLKQLEDFFNLYLHKKAPFHLPAHVKEWIVTYSPWIDLVVLVVLLPIIIAALGITFVALPFIALASPFGSLLGIIHWIIILASFAFHAAALPGLFHRSIKSWYLVYYGVLLNSLATLLSRDIFGFIIGLAISLFILFEIKELYH